MNSTMKRKVMIIAAVMALWAAQLACDNGGTFDPDSGCIGQAANYESCVETVQETGAQVNDAVNSVLP